MQLLHIFFQKKIELNQKMLEIKSNLKASTVVGQLADSVKDKVNDFFSDSVMTTGVVVCSILLASYDKWIVY